MINKDLRIIPKKYMKNAKMSGEKMQIAKIMHKKRSDFQETTPTCYQRPGNTIL